jgi:hypothetical protein
LGRQKTKKKSFVFPCYKKLYPIGAGSPAPIG